MNTTFSSILVTLALTAASAHAQTIDASGTWDITFNTQNGPMAASITIKKDGDKLAGTMTGPQGDLAIEGTQKDKLVALNLSVQTPNGGFAIAMSGTQEGDALAGTVDFGGRGQAEWAGKRRGTVAAASTTAPAQGEKQTEKVDVTGAWAFTIDTGNGTGTPSVTFKQDGEKLTGHYSSQVLGERDFTGTVKGNAITFTIDADVQGTAVKVVYSGTVEKDTMKGKVVLGDLGEGTFTGKRK